MGLGVVVLLIAAHLPAAIGRRAFAFKSGRVEDA